MEPDRWIKSSFSYANGCVETLFHTSSHSINGSCVEVGPGTDHVHVRDSKDPTGPVLTFSKIEWDAFLAGARGGEFDLAVSP